MRGKTRFLALGARLSLLAILLSLIAQTLSFGVHTARVADDARAASAALAKVVGAPVWICVQDDGTPAPSGDCHDACPFCRLAGQTLSLTAPEAPTLFVDPPPPFEAQPLPPADPLPSADPNRFALARGPPRSL